MKSINDFAVYVEKIRVQGEDEENWKKVSDTTLNFLPKEIVLLDETNEEKLATFTEIKEGEKVFLIRDDNSFEIVNLSNVSKELMDTTNILDIFNDNSCIACFPLDGDSNDIGGNFTGVWEGEEQYSDDAIYGKSAKFNGSYLTLGDFTGENEIKSISLWFKYGNDQDVIIGDSKLFCFIQVTSNGDNFYFRTPNSDRSNYESHYVTADVEKNRWYHLVVVNSGSEIKVYVNKVLKGSFPANPFGDLTGLGLAKTSKTSERLHGNIDQVRLFNKVLSEDEIEKLFNEQSTYKYFADIPFKPKRVFFYSLPFVSISFEIDKDRIMSEITESKVTIHPLTSGEKLVTSTEIKKGEELIIEGKSLLIDSFSTKNEDETLYEVDISSLNLQNPPVFVFKKGFVDFNLLSSTTDKIEATYSRLIKLQAGDKIFTDFGLLSLSDVNIEYDEDNNNYKYILSFNSLDDAPSFIKIPLRSYSLEIKELNFDGEKFIAKYKDLEKTARAIERRIVFLGEMEVLAPFTSQMYKGD